jgi:hypothetical protein
MMAFEELKERQSAMWGCDVADCERMPYQDASVGVPTIGRRR